MLFLAGTAWTASLIGRPAWAIPSATDIMARNRAALRPKGMTGVLSLIIIEPHGERREFKLTVWSRLQADGVHSAVKTRFSSPPDLRDTAFLQVESDTTDTTWVYLPALGKVRRLPSTEKKSSFFGSDFTNGDVMSPDIGLFRHTLLREESVGGSPCHIVESVLIDTQVATDFGYVRKVTAVDTSTYVDRKTEYFDQDGKQLRIHLAFSPVAASSDNATWVMQRREMTHVPTGRKTVMQYQSMQSTASLSDQIFSSQSLRDGA